MMIWGDVKDQEEQQRAQDTSLLTQGDADTACNDAQRTLEERVADTGKRTHQANLDVVDDGLVELGILACLALQRRSHTGDGTHHMRSRIEDGHVTGKRLSTVFLGLIEALDGRPHRHGETQALLALVVIAVLQEEGVPEQLVYQLLVLFGQCILLITHRTGHPLRQQ